MCCQVKKCQVQCFVSWIHTEITVLALRIQRNLTAPGNVEPLENGESRILLALYAFVPWILSRVNILAIQKTVIRSKGCTCLYWVRWYSLCTKKLRIAPSLFQCYPEKTHDVYFFIPFSMFKYEYIKHVNTSMFTSWNEETNKKWDSVLFIMQLAFPSALQNPWPFSRPIQ